jgi:membrane fusion protein, epimerase transport system
LRPVNSRREAPRADIESDTHDAINEIFEVTDDKTTDNTSVPESLNSGFTGAKRTGLIAAFLVFGVFGVWATTAPIDGASHAQGTVTVRSHKKLVQHLEGGIIADILVSNGSVVAAGDPLFLLDATQSRAQLDIVRAQMTAGKALEARLIAERDGLDSIEFPDELRLIDVEAAVEIESQTRIFNARRDARVGRVNMLEHRIEQLQSRLVGLREMQSSKEELMNSYRSELEEVRELLSDGFSDTNRLRQVERSYASVRGEIAELSSNIAATEMQISETRMEIVQVEREFQSEVVSHLGETQSRLKDQQEQRVALQDVVNRKVVRAPDAGVVNGMEVHTIGGVIPPGAPVAEIVPEGDELIIEARVSPVDIDRVAVGQSAYVRFTSFSAQTTPNVTGTVIHVSADAIYDQQTGLSHYMTRISVDPDELEAHGNLILVPGMPAEVFISSGARTLMQYLLKPITSAMARSFIED